MIKRRLTFFNTWNISYLPSELKNFALLYCSNKIILNYTRSRWMDVSPLCTFCLINGHTDPQPETLKHILLDCQFTKYVVDKMMAPFKFNGEQNPLLFTAGFIDSPFQKFVNIEIISLILFLIKSKHAKRNPSFASLKHLLKLFREEMSTKSKAYRTMKQSAISTLDPEFLHSPKKFSAAAHESSTRMLFIWHCCERKSSSV